MEPFAAGMRSPGVQELVRNAHHAQVAETWWSMRSYLLGEPHGSRSSLLVNQYTGGHMRKILEALNNSGMYGPVKEWSLDMLSKKKRELIGETLLRTALKKYEKGSEKFTFELNGERCKASVRDTWDDGYELSVNVMIGASELVVSGFITRSRIFSVIRSKGQTSAGREVL